MKYIHVFHILAGVHYGAILQVIVQVLVTVKYHQVLKCLQYPSL